jgi:Ca2+/Na+ antiporter
VLAYAAITIADEFEISDVLFGVVILSIATTLPDKFVAIMSRRQLHFVIITLPSTPNSLYLKLIQYNAQLF